MEFERIKNKLVVELASVLSKASVIFPSYTKNDSSVYEPSAYLLFIVNLSV